LKGENSLPPSEIKGCCPLDCQDGCSWVAYVEDGRVQKVLGSKEHPFTRGVLCAKVNDYEAKTYADDRLLYPLRRTGAKGEGAYTRITWDEALDEIAERFRSIIDIYGAEALMPLHDMGSAGVLQRRAIMRLFHAIGASKIHGSLCGASGNALVAAGHPIGFDPEDIAHSELILLWGSNLLSTAHHHWHFCQRARKENGARLIAIDPRRTRTARKCDEHVPIRPGTDAVLAAAMANMLIMEGLADLDYAKQAAADLDRYLDEIAPWTPDRAAELTGVASHDILRLAQAFATARPATILSGIGPEQSIDGDLFVLSLSAIAILAGHWRHKGGGLMIEAYPTLDNGAAERPDLAPNLVRSLDRAQLGKILTDPDLDPPVKGLMVWGHNPIVSQLEAERVRAGLLREDLFAVVIEHFMTDTARHADIVLPSTTQLEHFDVQGSWGHHYVAINHPAIEPLGEARPHADIMRTLALRLDIDHPALLEDDEAIARSSLPEEFDFELLKRQGWIKTHPPPSAPAAAGPVLNLASGLPPPTADRLPGEVPPGHLRLLTPKAHYFVNSTFGNMARQARQQGEPVIEIHPADAARFGLSDGQTV
jgi:anaerobic selenocysteine-containing dehydrogenase